MKPAIDQFTNHWFKRDGLRLTSNWPIKHDQPPMTLIQRIDELEFTLI